jgi:hypothetical protein
MLKVAEFLAQLDEVERLELLNAIGAGLHNARLAAQCTTDPGPRSEMVVQLLAYLSGAIDELEAARAIVRRRSA